MTTLLAQNILPLGTFKATATSVLRELNADGQPIVLTQHGRPAAVLLSPAEFDLLTARDRVQRAIGEGQADVQAGRTYGVDEVEALLAARLGDQGGRASRC